MSPRVFLSEGEAFRCEARPHVADRGEAGIFARAAGVAVLAALWPLWLLPCCVVAVRRPR